MYAIYKHNSVVVAVREVVDVQSATVLGVTLREKLQMDLTGAFVPQARAEYEQTVLDGKAAALAGTDVCVLPAAALRAETKTEPCARCGGSGIYRWGEIRNGVASHSGKCYDCLGKKAMSADDVKRDRHYHNHEKAI